MAHSSERNIAKTRFQIEDLQKRVSVLEATREDLERQIRKLNESVPEDEVAANAQKEGYVAYGSYAQSVIARKENLRRTLGDIGAQTCDLGLKAAFFLHTLQRKGIFHIAKGGEPTGDVRSCSRTSLEEAPTLVIRLLCA